MAGRPNKVIAIVAAAALALAMEAPALASTWMDPLGGGSTGEARANGLPVGPSVVTAACGSPTASNVVVTWSTVALATSYNVLESTATATGPYKVVAAGLAGSSWTGSKLATGNYWFEVSALVGANWVGAASAPSVETTVVKNKSCVQP